MAVHLLVPHEQVDKSYNGGFSLYLAAWSLLKNTAKRRFHAASSCASSASFLRWPRILLEYQP